MNFEQQKQYRKTLKGRLTRSYYRMKVLSKKRNMPYPNFTKKEFIEWALRNNFENIYNEWARSNFNTSLVPSINRFDDFLPYTFDNMEVVTWEENLKKWRSSDKFKSNLKNWWSKSPKCSKQVQKISLIDNSILGIYPSTRDAAFKNNAIQSLISAVCRGKNKKHKGFKWAFV